MDRRIFAAEVSQINRVYTSFTKLMVFLLFLSAFTEGTAQTFTETFDTNHCGGASCATFDVTLGGVLFDFEFTTQGDAGHFEPETAFGQGNSPSVNLISDDFNTSTTERVSITRNDAGSFLFTSIFINNGGGTTITVQGYESGNPVGSPQTAIGSFSGTLSFSGITVDEVRLTGGDFFNTNIDTFTGEIPASTPDISINDIAITENNATASFTVSLSAASGSTVTVDYATANGTATAGSDYTAAGGTVTFTPGQTSRTIDVTILEDANYENNETFVVNLSNPANANISDSQGQGTINNDDPVPTVTLDPSVLSKAEGAGSLYVVAQLSAASGLSTTINFAYSGTATSGVDYTASTSLVLAAGDVRDSIPINMVDDNLDEANETVIVDINSIVNGTESGTQQATYTISDDDETPVVTPGQSFAVNENSITGTTAGTVAASDTDAGTTFQNWTITTNANPDGDANNAFSINSSTGQITINDAGDLNYEANTSLIIQVTVSDGTNTSAPQNVTININDLDDTAPTLTINTGITLNEGTTETINSTELQANDTDTNNDNLVYAITVGPSNGQIELTTGPGISVSSFTQAQLNANQVVYVHDGGNSTSDSFTFDVQDGSGNNLAGQTFNITINPVDDTAPVITVNTGITLDEGATETINSTELQANDADTNNDNLAYAITTGPSNGQIELTTGPGTPISSFTQAQLNANQVVYVHDDGNTTSDSFTFDVQDGSGNNLTGQTFSITINAVDDDTPVVTVNTGITLDEGTTETINSTELQANDSDTNNDNLVYAITVGPSNGQIELTTGPGISVGSFTQAQLNANQAVYVHDGGNSTSDSFTFDVQDGNGNNLAGQTFSITINPVDDTAPVITVNTGITLDEGATETINSTALQANDADTNNDNLVYAITAGPANGQVELTTGPGISVNSFTQAQLNANQVVYVHDGSNTTSDSFTFDVQDGSGNNLTGQSFSITINPVDNTAPVITVNTGITLNENATETIDSGELQADDADTDNDNLIYAITAGPSNGQVELTTGPGTPVSSFTQAQLNANQVAYVHDGSNTTSDSFTFDVQDGSGNNLTGLSFSITITPIDDDTPVITVNTGITLAEGATETINNTELQASDADTNNDILVYAITAGPSNGQVELTTGPGTSISSFTQAQLNANQVVYVHDGSNTTSDSFTFDVQDGSGNNLTGQTFAITINTIDDEAPVLTVNTGITLNEGATETIDSGELQADDPDTNNDNLTYLITSAVTNGQLELTSNPGLSIATFTQAQLNANVVVYVHDDSNTTSDSFTFDVQDGSGNNLTGQTFSIIITPVDDDVPTITANTGIILAENDAEIIDSGELQANDTDTNNDNLTFAITLAPSNGFLELTTAPGISITSFTQAQVNANQVIYVHDGTNSNADIFIFNVGDGSGNNLTGQTFDITITPVDDDAPAIATNTGITLDEGATETINSTELQADDADTDNDVLTYVVTADPVNGQLELSANAGVAITTFTQAQLNSDQVVYVHDATNTTTDSFNFNIEDGSGNNLNGQTFNITITPVDDDAPVITTNTGITLDEGATETINSTELQADDVDTDNDILTLAITAGPSGGQIELTTGPGTPISSFTQAQLNANQVVYVHDDGNSTSDSFTFDILDGSGNNLTGQTFSITINAVDDDTPVITVNAGLTLDEGATETIGTSVLQANDPDTDNDLLLYNITSNPINGQVEFVSGPGVVITSFTQAQLNNNEVVYVHDHSNTIADSFSFNVEDGSGNNLTGQTFNIIITPVDDDPPMAADDNYVTNEDEELVIASLGVLTNDADTEAATLTAVLETAPASGTLNLNAGGGFSYTPDADFNGADSFTYRANDGFNNSNIATVNISVNAVNDAPVISDIADIEIEVNTISDAIGFEIGDVDNTIAELTVSATSSNTSILQASGIVLGGTGATRTIALQPVADALGDVLVTIAVFDGDIETTESFNVSVAVFNTPPSDITLSNQDILETLSIGDEVGTFETVDIDSKDTFSYSLVAGEGDADNDSFTLDGNKLLANTLFDFDLQQEYRIRVSSTDNRGASVEKNFVLIVTADPALKPVIYTGFTPDGDGHNDTWEIDNISTYPQILVRVYNRNGQEIFKSVGYANPWNGTYKGQELPVGTYYYIIELNDNAGSSYKGTVMILK